MIPFIAINKWPMNINYIGILTIFSCLSLAFVQGLYFAQNSIDTYASLRVFAHIVISLFATNLLMLASLCALLMGAQNILLKRHRCFVILQRLPPLQAMETLLFHLMGWGMVFLSGSLISGFLLQDTSFTTYLFSKALLALCAWIGVVFLLLGRFWFGWRGLTACRWTLGATLLTLLSYFGTQWL
jgi:ABC-type uncharacterized transport system permease subunit